jgi:tRNA pseudouridine(38-40) synthase
MQRAAAAMTKSANRIFDFSKHGKCKIALRVAYAGWDLHGFAWQKDASNTVEQLLFEALEKTRCACVCAWLPSCLSRRKRSVSRTRRLIESKDTCGYTRCARTDKGVSAVSQVVALNIRCPLAASSPGLQYLKMLNGVLPPTVRCTAVADVAPDFHARFSCVSRSYKYFFIRGSRNIEAMSAAANMFVGEHSFFNFCKIDPSKGPQQSFNRNVLHASIEPVRPLAGAAHPLDVFVFNVKATAFLWHQVRAMVAILFRVGDGIDAPGVVAAMLQAGRFKDKPNYAIADDDALLLWDCEFPPGVVQWRGDVIEAGAAAALEASTGGSAADVSAGRNLGPMFEICSQIVVRSSLLQHVVASSLGGDVRGDQVAALTFNPRKRGHCAPIIGSKEDGGVAGAFPLWSGGGGGGDSGAKLGSVGAGEGSSSDDEAARAAGGSPASKKTRC